MHLQNAHMGLAPNTSALAAIAYKMKHNNCIAVSTNGRIL